MITMAPNRPGDSGDSGDSPTTQRGKNDSGMEGREHCHHPHHPHHPPRSAGTWRIAAGCSRTTTATELQVRDHDDQRDHHRDHDELGDYQGRHHSSTEVRPCPALPPRMHVEGEVNNPVGGPLAA